MEALRAEGLTKTFAGVMALHRVTLAVAPGERVALIGPNGAGKTTLFNVVSGEVPASEGRVFLQGRNVTGLPPCDRCRLGLGRTFQKNNLFMGLTVFENVRLAVQARLGLARRFLEPAWSFGGANEETAEVLKALGLWEARGVLARDLSYGEQRQMEVAVALAGKPHVLLLDEPTAGMSPAETLKMADLLRRMPADLAMLIIEHDMDVVFALADRIAVLHYGELLAEGRPQEVKNNPRVAEVYLGVEVNL